MVYVTMPVFTGLECATEFKCLYLLYPHLYFLVGTYLKIVLKNGLQLKRGKTERGRRGTKQVKITHRSAVVRKTANSFGRRIAAFVSNLITSVDAIIQSVQHRSSSLGIKVLFQRGARLHFLHLDPSF